MKPIPEQQTICDLAAEGHNTLIQALAGTGKTSTGKLIANAVPNKVCLSIFFNKKNAEEGMKQADRPSNMFYSTIHSLCYKQVMNEGFKSKLNNFLLFEDVDTSYFEKLLLNKEAYPKGEYQKELNKLQRIVLGCVKLWQQSDANDIITFVKLLPRKQLGYRLANAPCETLEDLELFIVQNPDEGMRYSRYIAATCHSLWSNMINSKHPAKITHDTYVKMFQLGQYTFNSVYDTQSKCYRQLDLLLLDECQDSNAVTLSIFNNQTHLQRIACGDRNQNLYAWRGARNDFSSFATWKQATLTESFRFGQNIADIANKVLALPVRNTKLRLIGRGTEVGTGQTAILCRTNATVLRTVFNLLLDGKKVYCVSKFTEMESLMYHMMAVLNDKLPRFSVPALKSFDTKEKMWQTIESNQELKQVYNLAKLISESKGGLYTGLNYLKNNLCAESEAEIIVSTIHAGKGLGFPKVIIADDFLAIKEGEPQEALAEFMESDSLTALLYVAITRAKQEVVLPSYLTEMFN